MSNQVCEDKWTNTLNWMDKHITHVSVDKVDEGVTWYKFVEKDSIQKEIGTICDGFLVSIIETDGVFSHALFLYDEGEMMTVVLSVFDSHVRVPLSSIMETMNVEVVSFH